MQVYQLHSGPQLRQTIMPGKYIFIKTFQNRSDITRKDQMPFRLGALKIATIKIEP
jgi:hypothetical protein